MHVLGDLPHLYRCRAHCKWRLISQTYIPNYYALLVGRFCQGFCDGCSTFLGPMFSTPHNMPLSSPGNCPHRIVGIIWVDLRVLGKEGSDVDRFVLDTCVATLSDWEFPRPLELILGMPISSWGSHW